MNLHAYNTIFELLKFGLGTASVDVDKFIDDSGLNNCAPPAEFWNEIYRLGVQHGIAAIQFDGLQLLFAAMNGPEQLLPNKQLKMKWLAHSMNVQKNSIYQYKIASELAGIYAKNGIRTVVLKGIAAGMNYPEPCHRPCGDFDCFLLGGYEKGNKLANEIGASVDTSIYVHSVIKYKGLTVENHRTCTGIRGSNRAKSFERLLQRILNEEGTTRIGMSLIECPSPMFNALYLTYHAQRHFLIEGGIALRHLCDWAMLVYKNNSEIDWTKFRSICEEYGLNRFAEAMTRVSEKVLNVKIPESYDVKKNDEADDYLLHEILYGMNSSTYGSVWMQRLGIIKDIFCARKRYRMFSDISYVQSIGQLVYGFCFDRKPKI